MKKVGHLISFFVIIMLFMLTACAPTTLKSVWKDDAYSGGRLKKVLVIGVDQNMTVKTLLEDAFTEQLKTSGTEAVPGHSVFSEEEGIDKRVIAAKVNELQVDALLISTLKDVADTGLYETYPTYIEEGGGYYGYYLQCCQIVSTGRNVVIETKIFDTKHDRLIWSAVTETIFEGSAANVIQSFVPVIITELHNTTLLP
jgi:hypothetical protein